MRSLVLVIAATLAGLLLAASSPAASPDVSVSFYDSLAPYGDWIENDRYGTVWTPRHVESTWRPYTRGQWVYTDYGWTWASDEAWGWATDHYGRWYLDPRDGWIWVPGDEWAPAWVSWRNGDGYVGWAPLPPGGDVFTDIDISIDPLAFCFVEERHFLAPGVYRHFVPIARNVTYLRMTRNVTRYARMDDRIINHGIDVRHFERITGHSVLRAQIREVWSATDARRAHIRNGEVALFHPSVVSSRPAAEPGAGSQGRARVNVDRAETAVRRQERERQNVESALARERRELEKRQQREIKHPPQVSIHPVNPAAREQIQERHEAERRAQAALEQRQREILQQRHEREQRTAQALAQAKAQAERRKSEEERRKHDQH